MQYNLRLRHQVVSYIRSYLNKENFLDIETPMLTKATPEGARDYLVPSRIHPGQFYALPQSPQLFKQLLMMSGFDKYYQVVRCFRDEDLRADRQPEFTQLDIEMSFIEDRTIMNLIEGMIKGLFLNVLGITLDKPFKVMSYHEAMRRFGSDKPDLRIPLELVDIAECIQQSEFKVFTEAKNLKNYRIVALKVPGGCQLSRRELDEYGQFVSIYGAKGLAYIRVNDRSHPEGLQSPILKFLKQSEIQHILDLTNAQTGDVLFFGSGPEKVVNESMGALRVKLGHDLKMLQNNWEILWVVDWPMFEKNDQGQLQAMHHPFTSPQNLSLQALQQNPCSMLAKAYDIVINGYEIGGGSIRIHQPHFQKAVFELLKLTEEEAKKNLDFCSMHSSLGVHPTVALHLELIDWSC